jgi:peptide/nickel transport system permease protein
MTTNPKTIDKYLALSPPSILEQLKEGWEILTAQKIAVVGLILILFWLFVAIFAPIVTTYGPLQEDSTAINEAPSPQHWLGTDHKGRDIWSRLAYGSRLVLVLAPISVLCALIIGITLGLVAGYYGGWIDEVAMRLMDTIMSFPAILLYMIVIVSIGASAINVVIAITIAGAPGIARLVRGLTLDIRSREYIAAAKLRGESAVYIMFVEILPNARGPLIVDAALRVGYTIFAIGTLGFLGLGLPPPAPDWGSMVNAGRRYIWTNPWAVLWPSLSISSIVVGLNLLADGLQREMGRFEG